MNTIETDDLDFKVSGFNITVLLQCTCRASPISKSNITLHSFCFYSVSNKLNVL